MARTNPLFDAWGVIYDAAKRLPNEQLKLGFVAALAELGITSAIAPASFRRRVYTGSLVYRADIDKVSGWRIHLQYENGQVHLKDVIEGQKHDDVLGQIEAKKIRYERPKTSGKK